MAFYPDELSPIDRICGFGNAKRDLPDVNPIKSRRQWKSLVLGKKDMGINNFATIAEEKEEEISGDEVREGIPATAEGGDAFLKAAAGILRNKKITFAKPRKYITPRLPERKVYATLKEAVNDEDFGFRTTSFDDDVTAYATIADAAAIPTTTVVDVAVAAAATCRAKNLVRSSTTPSAVKDYASATGFRATDSRRVPCKGRVSREQEAVKTRREPAAEKSEGVHVDDSGALPSERSRAPTQESVYSAGKQTRKTESREEGDSVRREMMPATAAERWDRRIRGSAKVTAVDSGRGRLPGRRDVTSASSRMLPPGSKSTKTEPGKTGRPKADKCKTDLNMKDVVNVYKNLAYGSEQEIKSFVERLSFVKEGDSKTEKNKNLLSVMNLKALETKIKNFAKNSGRGQENCASAGSKSKPGKKTRRAHVERLARQKVVKVPAVTGVGTCSKSRNDPASGMRTGVLALRKNKRPDKEEKEPWKYVGMQSILDKTYLVYPAYPPSVNRKRAGKRVKRVVAKVGGIRDDHGSPSTSGPAPPQTAGQNVKVSDVVVKSRTGARKGRVAATKASVSTNSLSVQASNKSMHRPSATTVCKVEFPPSAGQRSSVELTWPGDSEGADPSLLVYLHGTKAINVKSPYSDRQFSRVKFFRKDAREMPLIKGLAQGRAVPRNFRKVFVKNVSLPEKVDSSFRSLDFLDFEEDIQNINDFLHSQDSIVVGERRERNQGDRIKGRYRSPQNGDRDADEAARRRSQSQGRQCRDDRERRLRQQRHRRASSPPPPLQQQHQHGTSKPDLSPDSFVSELSQNIQHLQYLPDTEENRKLIAKFFDELDEKIDATQEDQMSLGKLVCFDEVNWPIPILGY